MRILTPTLPLVSADLIAEVFGQSTNILKNGLVGFWAYWVGSANAPTGRSFRWGAMVRTGLMMLRHRVIVTVESGLGSCVGLRPRRASAGRLILKFRICLWKMKIIYSSRILLTLAWPRLRSRSSFGCTSIIRLCSERSSQVGTSSAKTTRLLDGTMTESGCRKPKS
jgi:hypothetical protein